MDEFAALITRQPEVAMVLMLLVLVGVMTGIVLSLLAEPFLHGGDQNGG